MESVGEWNPSRRVGTSWLLQLSPCLTSAAALRPLRPPEPSGAKLAATPARASARYPERIWRDGSPGDPHLAAIMPIMGTKRHAESTTAITFFGRNY